MTMPVQDMFEVVKDSIIDNILYPAEQGQYKTIGFQQRRPSVEVVNELRQVTVFYSSGEFPKSAGTVNDKTMHDVTFNVSLAVAPAAEIDLSVLNNENATASDKATALRRMSEAGVIADREMDELIRIVRRILMDARNVDMGLAHGTVSDRWVTGIQKDPPVPDGEFAMLTASMRLTCRVTEHTPGEDLPTETGGIFETDIELNENPDTKQGVKEITT